MEEDPVVVLKFRLPMHGTLEAREEPAHSPLRLSVLPVLCSAPFPYRAPLNCTHKRAVQSCPGHCMGISSVGTRAFLTHCCPHGERAEGGNRGTERYNKRVVEKLHGIRDTSLHVPTPLHPLPANLLVDGGGLCHWDLSPSSDFRNSF